MTSKEVGIIGHWHACQKTAMDNDLDFDIHCPGIDGRRCFYVGPDGSDDYKDFDTLAEVEAYMQGRRDTK